MSECICVVPYHPRGASVENGFEGKGEEINVSAQWWDRGLGCDRYLRPIDSYPPYTSLLVLILTASGVSVRCCSTGPLAAID